MGALLGGFLLLGAGLALGWYLFYRPIVNVAVQLPAPPAPPALPGADPAQVKALEDQIEKQKARVAEGWINTHALSTGQDALPALPDGVTPATLAAYTVAARTLLSLDETITKQ